MNVKICYLRGGKPNRGIVTKAVIHFVGVKCAIKYIDQTEKKEKDNNEQQQ